MKPASDIIIPLKILTEIQTEKKVTEPFTGNEMQYLRVKDDTGIIEVEPEGIELVLLEETNVSSYGGKRYKETLLKDGQKMLLVGYADSKTEYLSSEKTIIIKYSVLLLPQESQSGTNTSPC